jgi:hypothetical protein
MIRFNKGCEEFQSSEEYNQYLENLEDMSIFW